MLQPHTQPDGIFELRLNNKVFKVKVLSPDILLSTKEDMPISFFKLKKGKTQYEIAMDAAKEAGAAEELTKEAAEKQIKALRAILGESLLEINGVKFDVATYFTEEDPDGNRLVESLFIFSEVINRSFFKFKKVVEVDKGAICVIDSLAKRYGKTPVEILFQSGGYSDMDAYVFNVFVASVGMQEEYTAMKRSQANVRRR